MSVDIRALLKQLEWLEYSPDSDHWMACPMCRRRQEQGHSADCELAAAIAEPPPTPVKTVVTEMVGNCIPFEWPPAPHTKVTEIDGQYLTGKQGYILDPSDMWPESLCDMVPVECRRDDQAMGPRGRFRITVEFWPEGEGGK